MMFGSLVLALAPIGVVLVLSEYLWRKKIIKGEKARKFIHILAGIWIAFWPLYIPFDGIFIFGALALTLLLYSRFTKLFHAIYAVERKTYGEIFYAMTLMAVAFLSKEPWIFTVSILLLAVADGGAAVVGRYWGRKNQYFALGKPYLNKSVVGTVTFVVLTYLSIIIGVVYGMSHGSLDLTAHNNIYLFGVLPIIATLTENVTPFGLDNLVTPVFAAVLLSGLV